MAKVTAPTETEQEVTATEAPAAELATFELDDKALSSIKRKGGREAAPAKYLEEVRAAIGKDKAFGIPVPEGTKGTKITAELRKAAKSLNVHVRLWDRSGEKAPEGTAPFVGFKVIDKPDGEAPAAE